MASTPRPLPIDDEPLLSFDQLADAICAGAANLTSYEYRWLRQVAEFDRRRAWSTWEQTSCAAWLAWQVGLDPRSAREKVRVARALDEFPLIAAAMERGHLCYSKVRALTRVVTPATEAALVHLALESTTAQLERIVAATRRATMADEVDAQQVWQGRRLDHRTEPDGSVVVTLRLSADDGAAFLSAVHSFVDEKLPGDPYVSAATRRADAALAMAVAAVSVPSNVPSLAPQPLLTVHVDCTSSPLDRARPAAAPDRDAAAPDDVRTAGDPAALPSDDPAVHVNRSAATPKLSPDTVPADDVALDPVCSVSGSTPDVVVPIALTPAAVLRACCDARVETVTHHDDGDVTVSRRSSVIRGTLRRSILARDRHCQFPGCTRSAGVEVHHLVHRANGGGNDPDNLIVLCRYHHHRLHDEHWSARRTAGGLEFVSPDGRVVGAARPNDGVPQRVQQLDRVAADGRARWQGDRLQLVEALTFLASPAAEAERAARHRARQLSAGHPRYAPGRHPDRLAE